MSFLSNFKECNPFREVDDALFFTESGCVMLFASSGIWFAVDYRSDVGPFLPDDRRFMMIDGRCITFDDAYMAIDNACISGDGRFIAGDGACMSDDSWFKTGDSSCMANDSRCMTDDYACMNDDERYLSAVETQCLRLVARIIGCRYILSEPGLRRFMDLADEVTQPFRYCAVP